jgi:hypothetical protein
LDLGTPKLTLTLTVFNHLLLSSIIFYTNIMSTDSVIMIKKNQNVVYGYCRGTQTDPSIFDYHKLDYVVVPFHHYKEMAQCYYGSPSVVSAETILKKPNSE